MPSRVEILMSEALGYPVEFGKPRKRLTKMQRLEKKLARLQERQLERINRGRTRGAGAGGFNRDVDNTVHQIQLVRIDIEYLKSQIENIGNDN